MLTGGTYFLCMVNQEKEDKEVRQRSTLPFVYFRVKYSSLRMKHSALYNTFEALYSSMFNMSMLNSPVSTTSVFPREKTVTDSRPSWSLL